ncbi:MAG: tyrosine-type recombinase/integrase, partial [Thermomicrobiales bacterium]
FPILTNQDLERVWTSRYLTGKSLMATRNRALVGLMLDTGLRRAEVANVTLQCLDLADCLLTVTGKGDKQRRVPFSSGVRALLELWLDVRGSEPGRLFWLAPQSIKTIFRRIKDELGLEIFHPHQLRHQAATMMVRNNADVASVQRILGHSDISTTLKYRAMSDEDRRAKHAAASPYDSLMKANETIAPVRRKRLSLKEQRRRFRAQAPEPESVKRCGMALRCC